MGETSEIYSRMNTTDQKLNCIDGKLTVLIDQNARLFRFLNIVGVANLTYFAKAGWSYISDAATLTVTMPAPVAQPTATFELLVTMPATLYTVTWFSGITWLDGTPTLEAGKKYLFAFRTFDSGATWIGNLQRSW